MVTLSPGDAVIHHSLTIHRTEPNTSDRLRRAIGLVYFAASAAEDLERRAAHDAAVKATWREQGKI
jgi:ectoine hydroxylase-related dioxygenase (phytanoyl-CoA dioxygenase family)